MSNCRTAIFSDHDRAVVREGHGIKKRWIALAAGCLIQTILGGIYAWSTFVPYLMQTHALNAGQCGLIFGVTILTFTLSMIFSGWVLTKIGARLTAGISALLFMSGYLLASVSGNSFILLLLSLGVVAGVGIGFGYVCPLSVAIMWFPERKGLVTGASVAGFGLGAILLSSIAEWLLLGGMDVLLFFRWLGLCSGAILLLGALLLTEPPISRAIPARIHSFSSVFTWPFCVLAAGLFAGTFAGLLIIGHLVPLLMQAGLTEGEAAVSISVFALGNTAGRVIWGRICDHLGYQSVPLCLCSFAVTAGLLLIPLPKGLLFFVVGLLGFGFGANFVVYASSLSWHFGTVSFPRLYPLCFLAYGLAGLIAPGAGGYLADTTSSYNCALYICIALLSSAGILSYMKRNVFAKNTDCRTTAGNEPRFTRNTELTKGGHENDE